MSLYDLDYEYDDDVEFMSHCQKVEMPEPEPEMVHWFDGEIRHFPLCFGEMCRRNGDFLSATIGNRCYYINTQTHESGEFSAIYADLLGKLEMSDDGHFIGKNGRRIIRRPYDFQEKEIASQQPKGEIDFSPAGGDCE